MKGSGPPAQLLMTCSGGQEALGECSSLSPVTLSPLFHAGLSKLCSQCTVYM